MSVEEKDDAPQGAAEETEDDGGADEQGSGGGEKIDVSETTAPSIGPDTVIEKEDPEDRLARHEQSDVDAMGLDKRREVIGGQYSPSVARQATMYGTFIAVVAALVVGGLLLVKELDQPPDSDRDAAPWTGTEIEGKQPQ